MHASTTFGSSTVAAVNAHFVGAGRSEPVDIDVEVNRHTKVASSVTVRVSQEGRLVEH